MINDIFSINNSDATSKQYGQRRMWNLAQIHIHHSPNNIHHFQSFGIKFTIIPFLRRCKLS